VDITWKLPVANQINADKPPTPASECIYIFRIVEQHKRHHIEIKSLWKNTEMPRNELPVHFCSYMLVPSQAGPGYQIDHREKRNKNLYGALKQH